MKIAFVAFEGAGEEAREREYVDAYTREHPDASVVQRVIATSALSAGTRKAVNASREMVGTAHSARYTSQPVRGVAASRPKALGMVLTPPGKTIANPCLRRGDVIPAEAGIRLTLPPGG